MQAMYMLELLYMVKKYQEIMFTLVTTGVRPIKVRFLNRFLRLSDKRLLTILIKKMEEDKS